MTLPAGQRQWPEDLPKWMDVWESMIYIDLAFMNRVVVKGLIFAILVVSFLRSLAVSQ